MALDGATLASSLELVASRQPVVTARFYEILFERYPDVKPLFGNNAADAQALMLQEAIVAVIDHVDDAEWLTTTLHGLGAKHVGFGVTEEMYPWVGECLIATLAEIAADDWNATIEKAWVDAYGAIVGLMLEGAAMVAGDGVGATGPSASA